MIALMRRQPSGGTLHIEDIQDQVELALMRGGEHEVARAYVLYRDARAQERARQQAEQQQRAANGHPEPFRVPILGIGNENWDCGGNMSPDHYVNQMRAYARFVRNFNPKQQDNDGDTQPPVVDQPEPHPSTGPLVQVEQGQRMGLIRFGSRVDVFIPVESKLRVQLGQLTTAGTTVLAELPR